MNNIVRQGVRLLKAVGDDHRYVNENAQTSAACIRLAYLVRVALAIGSCASSTHGRCERM